MDFGLRGKTYPTYVEQSETKRGLVEKMMFSPSKISPWSKIIFLSLDLTC